MSKTETIKIDPVEINSKLALFDNARELFNSISATLGTRNALAPLHDLCKGVEIDETMRNEFNTFSNDFIEEIDNIKKYINDIVSVDGSELLNDTKELTSTSNLSNEIDTVAGEERINDVTGTETIVGETNTTAEDGKINSITGEVGTVGASVAAAGSEEIVDITGTTGNVGETNTTAEDGQINGIIGEVGAAGASVAAAGSEEIVDITGTTGNIGKSDISAGEVIIDKTKDSISNAGTISINSNDNVIKSIYNANGDLIAVKVSAGGHEVWKQVVDGKVIEPITTLNGTFYLANPLEINIDGQKKVITPGNYAINQIFNNIDGTLAGIRINAHDYQLWLHFDSNGNITNVDNIRTQNGVFIIDNSNYKVTDMFGNIIDKFQAGNYYIYDVLRNSSGNVLAFNLSPNGEYEKWIYLDPSVDVSSYSLFDNKQSQSSAKANISMFGDNKALFGLLGILFVALGTTIVLKKKRDKKNDNNQSSDEDEEMWEEEELSGGNYAVYDVKKNDNGIITEARINPLDNEDEYWVEV